MELKIGHIRRAIIQEQYCGIAANKKLLERQNLTAVAQRVLGEQAYFGERVKHHTGGGNPFYLGQNGLGSLVQFDLGRVKHSGVRIYKQIIFRGDKLEEIDAIEGPAVRGRRYAQLLGRLGECNVETSLPTMGAIEQELHGQRRFAGAGVAFNQIEAPRSEPTLKNVIKPSDASRHTGRRICGCGVAHT
jgi:hypothetical protein